MAKHASLKNRLRNHRQSLQASAKHRASILGGAHLRCLLESLGRLQRRWLASLLTIFVIGIALALPAGLYILVKNLDTLSSNWHQSVRISVYLQQDLSSDEGQKLANQFADNSNVSSTHFISAEEGLRQFKQDSDFGPALDALDSNPLPGVVSLTPQPDMPPDQVERLVEELNDHSQVDHAELDQAWLRRLSAILDFISRSSWVIGILLSAAVLFIIGNTIRLDIENRRQEIEVMKLLGASNAFIRRPFLYSGLWYGLLGATIALFIIAACYIALSAPLSTLVSSYEGQLTIHGLGPGGGLTLLLGGIALGWLGCAITVSRELHAIEPR